MPKVLECALFSQECYGYAPGSKASKYFGEYIRKVRGWSDISTNIPHAPPKNAEFYAQLWYRKKDNGAVIAIRGTANFDNLKTDIKSWYPDVVFNDREDNIPQHYFRLANVYYHKCLDYLRKNYPKAKLSFTGHSLGGALAQIVVGQNQRPHTVVAFNSPGIGHMVPKAKNIASLIHNINSRYGFINKIGETIGSVDYVDVPEKEEIAKQFYEAEADEKQEEKILNAVESKLGFEAQAVMTEINADEQEKAASIVLAAYPQHKIGNLVDALKTEEYKTLAYTPYFGVRV